MKTPVISATLVAALLAAPAFAQSTAPATTPPAATTAPNSNMNSTSGSAAMSGQAAGNFLNTNTADQWLASDMIGMDVYGSDNQSVGEISDVLVDRQGNVVAVVIGVGGFLGIGQKDVAVPFRTIEHSRVDNADRLVLRRTKDELKNAPTFEERTATNTAPRTNTTAPAAGTTAPATNR